MKNNKDELNPEELMEEINFFKDLYEIKTLDDELEEENELESFLEYLEINKEIDYSDKAVENIIYLICNYKHGWDPILNILGDLLFQRILEMVKPLTYEELENIFKKVYPNKYKSICNLSYIIAFYKINYPLKTYVGYLNYNLDIIKDTFIFKKFKNKNIFKVDENAMEYSDMHNRNYVRSKISQIRIVFDDINENHISIVYDENNKSGKFGILDNNISIAKILVDEEVIKTKEEKLSKYKLSLLKKQCKWYNDNKELVKAMEIYEYDDNTSGYVLNIEKMKEWYIANGKILEDKYIQKYFEEEKYLENSSSLKFIKGQYYTILKNYISYDKTKSKQDECIIYKNKILLSKNIIEISEEKLAALNSYTVINDYIEDVISKENKGM